MRRVLISDSPETVGALASWLNERLGVNEKQCSVLALALLERKELKIKRGALDRVLKSLHGAERIDEMREALVSGGLIVQLGRDEFGPYRIRLDAAGIDADAVLAALRAEQADGDAAEDAVPSSEQDAPAAEGARVAEEEAACRDSGGDAPASNKNDGRVRERRERRRRSVRKGAERREAEPLAKRAPRGAVASERAPKAAAPREERRSRGLAVVKRGLNAVISLRKRAAAVSTTKDAAKTETPRKPAGQPSVPDDVARVQAWLDAHAGEQVSYASRRQRAYQIFDDEKALEGKRGDRLMRQLTSKGINPNALRIASCQMSPLQGFYGLGADQPFIVVENIDTYEEIVTLLKGRKSVRLFGRRIGGVIFGAGHNACVAHALDDYLNDIGYGFSYVYYAGDIDREGARLVERAREVNVMEIRLHVGMYRAMFAANRAHVQQLGNERESAANNQESPRDFARLVKDLPLSLRIPFKRALSDNIRIPQEVLTGEDFRRASHGAVDRMLNS